jgi:hypothetical protein
MTEALSDGVWEPRADAVLDQNLHRAQSGAP